MSEQKSDARFRSWATVVYPESAPENWQELLSDLIVPCFISPLHDKDTNPTGEPKKPHFHVLFDFEGKKSKEQMKELIQVICGVGCERVQTVRGYARYLCHLDNPEKAQYSPDEVKAFGGLDYIGVIGLPIDKYKTISEMIDFCEEQDITSYADLLRYASSERSDWFRVLCDSSTLVMTEYIKSRTWKSRKG